MKREILKYVESLNNESISIVDETFTTSATDICERFNIKRNTASRYLNELVTEGYFIKINTRPVLFLSKKHTEETLNIECVKKEYSSLDELLHYNEEDVFDLVIGRNGSLRNVIDQLISAANYPGGLPILFQGESGTGKSMLARKVYDFCLQKGILEKDSPFVVFNCAQYFNNPELLSSQLFGYKKGSFTGALSDRKGYFEVADGGTIFLDEVGELPTPTQARLLRVLETGEFIRVGSSKVQKTNVRIVAATNVNLTQAVAEGKFREDLFYRLSTVPIQVPPLRERGEDIILLFRKFASDCAEKYRMPPIRLDEEARQLMLSYRWPGNVRELKNITERISVIEENRDITASVLRLYLPDLNIEKYPVLVKQDSDQKIFNSEREILYQVLFDMKKDVNELKKLVHDIMGGKMPIEMPEEPAAYPHPIHTVHPVPSIQEAEAVEEEESLSLEEVEKEMIRKALEKHNGRRKNAAADLKISERTLYRKIKEYNLE